MKTKRLNLKRNRSIACEIHKDGSIGLELEKNDSPIDYQYLYFTLTKDEMQSLINLLNRTIIEREDYMNKIGVNSNV